MTTRPLPCLLLLLLLLAPGCRAARSGAPPSGLREVESATARIAAVPAVVGAALELPVMLAVTPWTFAWDVLAIAGAFGGGADVLDEGVTGAMWRANRELWDDGARSRLWPLALLAPLRPIVDAAVAPLVSPLMFFAKMAGAGR